MHTIQFQVEDNIYDDIVKSGINIQDELRLALHKLIYKKEYKIANDIKKGIDEVHQAKTRPIEQLFNEL
ncbi:MAG: hypothetical protein U9O83_05030 [Campylobacterota bacterium]|nr:hypothetical protein [Campylobacterota bacterium]